MGSNELNSSPADMIQCRSCMALIERERAPRFCNRCGLSLEPDPPKCPTCGTIGRPGDDFCISCGTTLQPRSVVIPVVAIPAEKDRSPLPPQHQGAVANGGARNPVDLPPSLAPERADASKMRDNSREPPAVLPSSPSPEAPGMKGSALKETSAVVGEWVRRFELSEETPLTLGRSRRNTVMLPSPKVSREHAQLEASGSQYILLDLNSTNGTRVNDQRIQQRYVLQDGDRIGIGPFELLLHDHALWEAPGMSEAVLDIAAANQGKKPQKDEGGDAPAAVSSLSPSQQGSQGRPEPGIAALQEEYAPAGGGFIPGRERSYSLEAPPRPPLAGSIHPSSVSSAPPNPLSSPAESSPQEVKCPTCGATALTTDKYCYVCGMPM